VLLSLSLYPFQVTLDTVNIYDSCRAIFTSAVKKMNSLNAGIPLENAILNSTKLE
jgi:hypothetical protein